MRVFYTTIVIIFILLYSALVFLVDAGIGLDVVSELTVASVFFFALFSGFFISRQNERYTRIIEIIATRDGIFSYLYRVSGLVPRMQVEVKEITRNHYNKILKTKNWAHNELNTSTTLTDLTKVMGSLTKEEVEKLEGISPYDGLWGDTILELQKLRKKIIAAYNEKLLVFQWVLIYVFATLVIVSFYFLQTDLFIVDVLKVIFGTSVFLVVILIKQLNDLSLFGKDFSTKIANDVLRILDEADAKEKSSNL